jgi:hypothetical protein
VVAINNQTDRNETLKMDLAVVLANATRKHLIEGSKMEDAIIEVGMFAISFSLGGVVNAMGKDKPTPEEGRALVAAIFQLLQSLPDKQ